MAIKQDIERAAAQVGATVRQALSDFAKETGMHAQVEIEWVETQTLRDAARVHVVGLVRIKVGGLAVEV